MRIMLIDDDATILGITTLLLRRMGHDVLSFNDPRQALASLPNSGADLIVSDILMPDLSGFDVAARVAETLGTVPPRVLLVSGYHDMRERMEETPPSVVIGVLPKPFAFSDLSKVISVLERARDRCPGTLHSFCPHARKDEPGQTGCADPCHSPSYATCPHYDSLCGKELRHWIRTQGTGATGWGGSQAIRPVEIPKAAQPGQGFGAAMKSFVSGNPNGALNAAAPAV